MAEPSMVIQETNPSNKGMLLPAVSSDETKKWMLIPAEYQDETKKRELLAEADHEQTRSTLSNSGESAAALKNEARIRRPPNAFIIFAKEWRKNLTAQNPGETSKQISSRLGAMWKSLTEDERELYTDMARKLDAEHKKKYPDYVYCPNAARIQKALRAEARGLKRRNVKSGKTNTVLPGTSFNQQASQKQRVCVEAFHETVYPEVSRPAFILPKPGPSWTFVEQERGHRVATKGVEGQVGQNMIQGCTYQYLNVDKDPYQQSASHSTYRNQHPQW
jgi:hypothetical protein